MVHDSMRNLRLDKRLTRRRGWLPPDELEKELAALPDVGEKAERIPVLEVEREAGDAAREPS